LPEFVKEHQHLGYVGLAKVYKNEYQKMKTTRLEAVQAAIDVRLMDCKNISQIIQSYENY
jgi:hypothetical protein